MTSPKAPSKNKKTPSLSDWHSRGYLPHFESETATQDVTFRLFDAVPKSLIEAWKTQEAHSQNPDAETRKLIEKYSDAGHGACYLRNPSVASMVQDSLIHFDGVRYHLHAWVVMPNHVHWLFTPMGEYKLKQIMHSVKSDCANEANLILDRSGTFWMADYFDRWIRNEQHFKNAVRYIENNPVKAGLCRKPEYWPWSSAHWRAKQLAGTPSDTDS
jgi:REP element-mobilizing transposase RayT